MLCNLIRKNALPLARQFGTSAVRQAHDTSGIAGSTLPFGIQNRLLLTLGFMIYFSSGIGLPFLVVRRNLLLQK